MGELILHEQTQRLLEDPLLGDQTVDTKVRALVEAEYVRRLARYRQADHDLSLKYGLTFHEFHARHMVQLEGYTWEVEQDAMNWEAAVSGIQTLDAKLNELQAAHD